MSQDYAIALQPGVPELAFVFKKKKREREKFYLAVILVADL